MLPTLKKLYQRFLYLRREIISYYCYYLKSVPTDQIRVVIFAQGRTGSTLLEDLISKTGYFEKHGELFNKIRGEILFPLHFILGLPTRNSNKNFIFHVKIYQLTYDRKHPVDPTYFINTLYKEGWKIIYLRRKNKVKHVLSNKVANARGASRKFDNKNEKLSLYIDIDSFIDEVKGRNKFDEREQKILQDVDYHEVVYEDDLENQENQQETVNRILDYLSMERKHVSTRLRKVNTVPLHKLIKNYDQFEKRIIQEGWGELLDVDGG